MGRYLGQATFRYQANLTVTSIETATNVNPVSVNTRYFVDTRSGTVTLTLPQGPAAGNFIEIIDSYGVWDLNNCIVNPSGDGSLVSGFADNLTINVSKANVRLTYSSGKNDWILTDSL